MKRILAALAIPLIALIVIINGAATPILAGPPLQASPTPELSVGPSNPTPSPVPNIPQPQPPQGGGEIEGTPVPKPTRIAPPPTLDELVSLFPDLQPYLERVKDLKLADMDLGELYAKIIQIFNAQGATGVAAFLKDSGILDKLGIPVAYLDLLIEYDKTGFEGVQALALERGLINDADEIIGYLALDDKANLDAVRATLEGLGVTTYDYSDDTEELEIGIPLDVLAQYQTPGTLIGYLAQVATTEHVVGFRGPTMDVTTSLPRQGEFKTVGAETIGADAWHAAGITGQGIRIGILDLGFGGIQGAIEAGQLPATVQGNFDLDDLDEQPINHGTACAIVAHGVAPDAEIFVAYYQNGSSKSLISALQYLEQNKVNVLNYSVSSLVGPRNGAFGTALLVDAFVRDTGILWVNSAGNYALSHSIFRFNPDDNGVHFFDEENVVLPFKTGSPVTSIVMNWNGKWSGGENTEYIFTVYDQEGNEVVTAAEPRRGKKNQLPFQATGFESEPGAIYFLQIARTRGDTDNIIDLFIPNALLPRWAQVPSYSVTTPGDSNSALTVGATGLTVDELEPYSSQGPTTDDRLKPDVSAPTGEQIFGYEEDGFAGTSGAAPLVAGASALVLSKFPDMTAAELKAFMMQNVLDLGESGEDPQFGTGRIALPDPEVDPNKRSPGKRTAPTTEPSATITDIQPKFNVKVRGVRGMVISVSFELNNYSGKQIIVAAIFGTPDGKALPSADERYSLNGGLATATGIKVGSNASSFEDVVLFIPNTAFTAIPEDLDEFIFIVGILDATDPQNPTRLAISDPVTLTIRR